MINHVYTYGPERQLLVIETDTGVSADVLQQALRADRVASTSIAVRFSYSSISSLRQLGYAGDVPGLFVPSEFVNRFKTFIHPFAHQYKTAQFLTSVFRGYCLDDPGTGKTIAATLAAETLIQHNATQRVLVICPLSIMRSAWADDIFKVCMHRTVAVAHGSERKRLGAVRSTAEFIIVNFDGVSTIADAVIDDPRINLIIVDEATAYSDAATKRWKALQRIVKAKPDASLWLMTGTPAANSPEQAYGLAKLCTPSRVPKYFSEWRDKVMHKVKEYRYVPKSTASQSVHEALQPAIRHSKDECLDLPPLVYQTRSVPLSAQQAKYYNELRSQFLFEAAQVKVTAVNAAIKQDKLVQISCGMVYGAEGQSLEFDATPKLQELEDIIDTTSSKLIVFTPYIHTLSMIERFFTKKGYTYDVVNGAVSATRRTNIFHNFQTQPDPKILLAHPECMSHGVTLTAADTVVWWGPVSDYEEFSQANARIHRNTQKHACRVVILVSSPAERARLKMCVDRLNDNVQLLSMYQSILDEQPET